LFDFQIYQKYYLIFTNRKDETSVSPTIGKISQTVILTGNQLLLTWKIIDSFKRKALVAIKQLGLLVLKNSIIV
jgi:hypothetical protein